MSENPCFVEVHRANEPVRVFFASEAKLCLKEGILSPDDPAKLKDASDDMIGLAALLRSLPKQRARTSGQAEALRRRDFQVWRGMRHEEAHYLINSDYIWRKKEITIPQIKFLQDLGVEPSQAMTSGEASDLIKKLLEENEIQFPSTSRCRTRQLSASIEATINPSEEVTVQLRF